MSDRFLSRWSRLKRENGLSAEPKPDEPKPIAQQQSSELISKADAIASPEARLPLSRSNDAVTDDVASEVLPTEDNLQEVLSDGGIQQFLNPKVDAALRNKAFKTLFQLPELGVIDYLDVYMDDFNVYDKLDEASINLMESAKSLLSRPDLAGNEAVENSITQTAQTPPEDAEPSPEETDKPRDE